MDFKDFSQFEKEVVLDCLKAILSGKFLWEVELHIRIGIHRHELEDVVRRWPNLSSRNLTDALAVLGCLGDAVNDIPESQWPQWVRCTKTQALAILSKWNDLVDWESFNEQKNSDFE